MVGNRITEAKHHHGGRLADRKLARAPDWISWAAAKADASQVKVLSPGDRGVGGDVVAVIKQQAGTDVEPVAKRCDVYQGLNRAVMQRAVILDAVRLEAVAEAQSVGADSNVRQRGN